MQSLIASQHTHFSDCTRELQDTIATHRVISHCITPVFTYGYSVIPQGYILTIIVVEKD